MNYRPEETTQFNTGTFLILMAMFFAGCYTQPDESLQQFKKVDSLLDVNESGIDANSLISLYKNIQLKKDKNIQLAFQAETLFRSIEKTNKFIDSLKDVLHVLDPSGEKLIKVRSFSLKVVSNQNW